MTNICAMNWHDDFAERASRCLKIERADSRDRNTGGQSTGNRGGGGRSGSTGGSSGGGNPDQPTITRGLLPAPGPNQRVYPGFTHTKQSPTGGLISFQNGQAVVSPTPQELQQQKDIIGGWQDYNNRGIFHKAIDALAGPLYNENMPNLDDPRTYWGGHYHTSTDPLGTAAMIAGSAFGIPGLGTLTQGAEDLTGVHPDIYHNPPASNYGPTHYGMPGASPNTSDPQQAQNQGGFSNTGGGPQHLQTLAQINQPVSGNPSAPQPIGPTGSPPTTPTGPNYQQILASMQQITPGYGVQLPGYQYTGRRGATV